VLRARISEKLLQEEQAKYAGERKSKVGTGDRSERIRTYNYPQSRVTDHRIGLTLHRLDSVLNGDMNELVEALTLAEQTEMMDKDEQLV
jgi:peptide chain release factor 1